jgi:putative ABC transport system ATP-binding protein
LIGVRDLPIVETEHLSKTYFSNSSVTVQAVVDVSLEVKQGETLLISGPNGSGKTTLLSMIGCLLKPYSGTIKICGNNVIGLSQRELALFRLKNIGFIFQSFRLLDFLTARENVELILNLTGMGRPDSSEKAEMLLDEVEMLHRSDFFPKALSGGERQRVAIARALANEPRLVLADEPTGSLDSHAGQTAIRLLCHSAQKRNKAVIIVSHDPRIRSYAQRIIHMEDGRIKEERQV